MVIAERDTSKKGEAFSIRLSASTDFYVENEAKRRRRSKSSIVEALTEEAARMHRFPGIAFMGEDYDRRAWIVGTGMDVWELVELRRSYGGDDAALVMDFPRVTHRHLRLAQVYHASHPEEIDDAIAQNNLTDDELRILFPFAEFVEVD